MVAKFFNHPTSVVIAPPPEYDYVNEVINVIKEDEFDSSSFNPTKCKIPDSCCPEGGLGDGFCGMNVIEKPYLDGCYEKVTKYFVNSTALFAGVWLVLWLLMMLQIIAARFMIRRIRLERKCLKEWKQAKKISDELNKQNEYIAQELAAEGLISYLKQNTRNSESISENKAESS